MNKSGHFAPAYSSGSNKLRAYLFLLSMVGREKSTDCKNWYTSFTLKLAFCWEQSYAKENFISLVFDSLNLLGKGEVDNRTREVYRGVGY